MYFTLINSSPVPSTGNFMNYTSRATAKKDRIKGEAVKGREKRGGRGGRTKGKVGVPVSSGGVSNT